MRRCAECGSQIPEGSTVCADCGSPLAAEQPPHDDVPPQGAARTPGTRSGCLVAAIVVGGVFLLAVLVLAILNAGGGDDETAVMTTLAATSSTVRATSPPTTQPPETASPEGDNVYAYGDAVIIGGLEATVLDPIEDTAAPAQGADTVVMAFEVTLANRGTTPADYSRVAFTAYDADGYAYPATATTSMKPLGSGVLAPGATVEGFVACEVPAQVTIDRLIWTSGITGGPQAVWH